MQWWSKLLMQEMLRFPRPWVVKMSMQKDVGMAKKNDGLC